MQYFQASRAHNLWVHHKVLAAAMSARDESNNRWFSSIIVKYVRKYKLSKAGGVFRRPKKCHIVRTAERLQTFELSLNPIYNILDFQLCSNPMISCCLGRALARTGFTLVMTSTECTPRIARKRWWTTIRRIIKFRNNHFIIIIHNSWWSWSWLLLFFVWGALYDFVFETILMNGKRLDGVRV